MGGRSIIFLPIVIILILVNQINGQKMELVAGHVVYRHGDRTPISTYPSDTAKDWPVGPGQLTSAGIEQQHRLGQYLRTRYGSLLSSTYNASEFIVRSTDYDRTLMSAEANLIGLYPLDQISKDKVPIQLIPIHTVPSTEDFLLSVSDCPRYKQLLYEVNHGDAVKKLYTNYEPFFKKLENWTNITDISIRNTEGIAITIYIENLYNKAPEWADAKVRQTLSVLAGDVFYMRYTTEDSKRIRGGPLIQDIWLNMNNASQGQPFRKVKMYSAHDITISPVLAFLGINYPHQPQYASALFVDLYKQNSTYFVKVEYLNVTDSNVAYPYVLDGCPGYECPLNKFTAIYQPRFPGKPVVECALKPTPTSLSNGRHKKLIITLSLVAVCLVFIIFLAFFCCHLRKGENQQPLLSANQN